MPSAFIADAVRTPIGKHKGALSAVRPDDLAAVAIKALLQRTGVEAAKIESLWYRWAAGIDCELDYVECVRVKLIGA